MRQNINDSQLTPLKRHALTLAGRLGGNGACNLYETLHLVAGASPILIALKTPADRASSMMSRMQGRSNKG